EYHHDKDSSHQILTYQTKIDLCTEEDEYEQAHDEGGGRDVLIKFVCLTSVHAEAERIFVSEHHAKDEHGHEPARLQTIGCEIGPNHGHQCHHWCVFGEECPSFMGNEQCGEIA